MTKKDYFDFLKEHLPNDKYKERFLEELEDHYEDAVYAETFTKKSAEEMALSRLGDPEQTILFYQKLMKQKSTISVYFESLFYGILSSPLYLALFVANSITESSELLLAKAVFFVLGASALWTLFYFFYRAFFSRLRPLNSLLSDKQKVFSFLCALAPTVATTLMLLLMFYFDDRQDYYFPVVIAAYLAGVVFAAWKAYQLSFKKPWNLRPTSPINHLLVLALLGLFLLTEAGEVIAFFLKVMWVILFTGNLKLAIVGSGLGLLLLGVYSFISLLAWGKKRSGLFPLFKFSVFLGVLYALFIPSINPYSIAEEMEWSKPHQEIGRVIESAYFKPFYTWSLKFRKDDGPEFEYFIRYIEDGFLIRQHGVADYLVTPTSGGGYTLSKLSSDPSEALPQERSILHEDLTCVLSDMAEASHAGIQEPPTLGGETDCKELYFKDELVYRNTTGEWLMLSDAVFSPDEKWLLLRFQDVMEDPARLYMVEL